PATKHFPFTLNRIALFNGRPQGSPLQCAGRRGDPGRSWSPAVGRVSLGREQAVEFGIEVVVVRLIVHRMPAEILPEPVCRRRLSLDQSARPPTFPRRNPYALGLFKKPRPTQLTTDAVERVPEPGQALACLHQRALNHALPPRRNKSCYRFWGAHARW